MCVSQEDIGAEARFSSSTPLINARGEEGVVLSSFTWCAAPRRSAPRLDAVVQSTLVRSGCCLFVALTSLCDNCRL